MFLNPSEVLAKSFERSIFICCLKRRRTQQERKEGKIPSRIVLFWMEKQPRKEKAIFLNEKFLSVGLGVISGRNIIGHCNGDADGDGGADG